MRIPSFAAVALTLAVLLLGGNGAQAHIILFKDGFMLAGKVREPGHYTGDPATGQAVWITSGAFVLDVPARRVFFSMHQLQDVLDKDLFAEGDLDKFESRISRAGVPPVFPLAQILDPTDWDEKWDRTFRVRTPQGRVDIKQRLGLLTPQYLRVDAYRYLWSAYYLTSELGPDAVRSLLYSNPELKSQSAREDPTYRLRVSRFLTQAGWYDQAEEELNALLKDRPEEKDKVEAERRHLRRLRALQGLEELERANQAGRFAWVNKHLAGFPRVDVDEKVLAGVRALRATYETAGETLTNARRLLKALPAETPKAHRALFTEAAAAILAELDQENAGRLDSFLTLGLQAERDRKDNRKPANDPAQLMALAVTGWLMGKQAAEPKVEAALRLWRARAFVLKYLNTDDADDRARLLKDYQAQRTDALPVDEMTNLIKYLPPPRAEKDLGTEPLALHTEQPTGRRKGINYLVQLPPEYHHSRAYPVLFVLHHTGERARDMLARVKDQAARYGYLVVAPESGTLGNGYEYTAEEHKPVTDVLRDVRRRFSVDSDRVFLMGVGEGANMAFDVGLSHPDLFAGVLPVAGFPRKWAERYWPNCLHLPFYVVDGDLAGILPKFNQNQFKKWIPMNYPCLYVQYKGRGLEWFPGELPTMFDWMEHKKGKYKRSNGLPQLGRRGGSLSQEFQILRSTDNRFYWVSTDEVRAGHALDNGNWDSAVLPATLQAYLNEGTIYLTVRNLKQVSVWLSRDMIDFNRPVSVRINDRLMWQNRLVKPSLATMLEDLYTRGDQQRLFWAKLDFSRF
jgi:hypothetical protein